MVGYSGTPLAKKLNIKEGSRVFLVNPPPDYLELLAPLPGGVTLLSQLTGDTDIVQIFTASRIELQEELLAALRCLQQTGFIWVSWPKKSSKVPTDITEDVIREIALPLGLVDIKVCAIDAVWSGLKLVIRKANRI